MRQENSGQGAGKLKRRLLSSDCNWNAVTIANPVNFDGLAGFSAQLQAAGGQVRCFQVPGKGILVVSWRRPDAQVS